MRAVVIREPGDVEVLEVQDRPDPVPNRDELLVRVRATAMNRADLLQRRGLYPAPKGSPADIPGLEFAGEVEAVGSDVTRFQPGARVMGIVGSSGYAEKLVVHERAAVAVPENLSWAEAAAIPEAWFTAFDAALLQAALKPGENLLVNAVGSGVGTAAVQLGKLVGARVLGTARSEPKLARAKALGLDVGLVAQDGAFADAVMKETGRRGADVVLELVGGDYTAESVRASATKGRILLVGLMAGPGAELPLGLMLSKRVALVGTTLRARPLEEKLAVAQAFERQVLPHFASGRLKPVLDEALPMAEVREAHRRMEANANFGKIALVW